MFQASLSRVKLNLVNVLCHIYQSYNSHCLIDFFLANGSFCELTLMIVTEEGEADWYKAYSKLHGQPSIQCPISIYMDSPSIQYGLEFS